MPQGKQAKVLTPRQERRVLRRLEATRYPARDRVIFLLSIKAGLRAKEIASLTWAMATDAEGNVAEEIALTDASSKGTGGGRTIPMHPALQEALGVRQAVNRSAADVFRRESEDATSLGIHIFDTALRVDQKNPVEQRVQNTFQVARHSFVTPWVPPTP